MAEKAQAVIIRATGTDPWYNMAVEEYLFHHLPPRTVILYLWQVADTVMVGKYQNPWKECNCRELERGGGKLARRISGGGAVFQDLGNFNFSFIVDRELYDLEKQLRTVLQAVARFGIRAGFSGRNDLTVEGRKFSGNAFYFRGEAVLHHGTLLINSDLTKLSRYLRVSREKIASKGVDSVQARVVNLASLNDRITVEAVMAALEEGFSARYGGTVVSFPFNQRVPEIQELYKKHASWAWRYGETPDFDISFRNRFSWGEIELCLSVTDGQVTRVVVYSDALDCSLIEELTAALNGRPFRQECLVDRVACLTAADPERRAMLADLTGWLSGRVL